MNVTVLVDFENDSARTAVEVADALGDDLWGVRLDTSETLVDKALEAEGGPPGVNPELVRHVRAALDDAGHERVRIVASGGFTAEKIAALRGRGRARRRLRRRLVARARLQRLHRRRRDGRRAAMCQGRPRAPAEPPPRASRLRRTAFLPMRQVNAMIDKLHDVLRTAAHAIGLLADSAASVNVPLLLLGTVLYVLHQCVRTIGWHTILRAAYPEARATCAAATSIRRLPRGRRASTPSSRRAAATWSSSRSCTATSRARAGHARRDLRARDPVRVRLRHRARRSGRSRAGSCRCPNAVGEVPVLRRLAVRRAPGHLRRSRPSPCSPRCYALWRLLRRRGRVTVARVKQGLAILGSPRLFITGVVSLAGARRA